MKMQRLSTQKNSTSYNKLYNLSIISVSHQILHIIHMYEFMMIYLLLTFLISMLEFCTATHPRPMGIAAKRHASHWANLKKGYDE